MYRAKETFWGPDNRHVVKGDLIAPHDPIVTGREDLFETVVIPQAVAPAPTPAAPHDPTAGASPAPDTGPPGPASTEPTDGPAAPAGPPPAAETKTAAKKTTPAARKPAGGVQ
ncbi:hypothetical protein ACFXAZ_38150 [Streptomyces sp. NPDC059477]|uniref:hypothetical protein n=1 Tax=Streptomyces sp. NPDC059477 TaxID=3346847 RepID=UPI00368E068C